MSENGHGVALMHVCDTCGACVWQRNDDPVDRIAQHNAYHVYLSAILPDPVQTWVRAARRTRRGPTHDEERGS